MSSLLPFSFNNTVLFNVLVDGKTWTRAKEVCEALEYQKGKSRDILRKHVGAENKQHKFSLEGCHDLGHPLEWPKNSQPSEYYINEEGLYELVFTSQQPKAKEFLKFCFNDMFPKIRKELTDKIIEEKKAQFQDIQYESMRKKQSN